MKSLYWAGLLVVIIFPVCLFGDITVRYERVVDPSAKGPFRFSHEGVASPTRNDAASTATFELIDGRADPNGGGLVTRRCEVGELNWTDCRLGRLVEPTCLLHWEEHPPSHSIQAVFRSPSLSELLRGFLDPLWRWH